MRYEQPTSQKPVTRGRKSYTDQLALGADLRGSIIYGLKLTLRVARPVIGKKIG